MVDLTPELLQERLRQGKVYEPAKVQSALKNFFRKGNLLALREMALLAHFSMAKELGAECHDVKALDVVEELVRFAEEYQLTQLVLGAGRPSRWEEISRGSLIHRIMRRRTDKRDLLIVSDQRKK